MRLHSFAPATPLASSACAALYERRSSTSRCIATGSGRTGTQDEQARLSVLEPKRLLSNYEHESCRCRSNSALRIRRSRSGHRLQEVDRTQEPKNARTEPSLRRTSSPSWSGSRVGSTGLAGSWRSARQQGYRPTRPNPSFEPTPNGIALGPRGALVHHAPRGPSTIPSVAAHLKR